MKIVLSLLFIILPILGLADTVYLTYESVTKQIVPCAPGFDCQTVLTSDWAYLGPVPLSGLGILYYATLLGLGLAHYLQTNLQPWVKPLTAKFGLKAQAPLNAITPFEVFLLVSKLGFLFSLFLVFLMGWVINAWCIFCLFSALISTLLFASSLYYFFNYHYREAKFLRQLIDFKVGMLRKLVKS